MSCDKCEDIHIAQRAGKQSDECRCSCHNGWINPSPWHWEYNPLISPYTGDPPFQQFETTCKSDDTKGFSKPKHGFTYSEDRK